jgi:hypothetical protein
MTAKEVAKRIVHHVFAWVLLLGLGIAAILGGIAIVDSGYRSRDCACFDPDGQHCLLYKQTVQPDVLRDCPGFMVPTSWPVPACPGELSQPLIPAPGFRAAASWRRR